jgi:hypothetical protein
MPRPGTGPGCHAGRVSTPAPLAQRLVDALRAAGLPGDAELLDPACGEGALLHAAAEGPWALSGIELDAAAARAAGARLGARATVRRGDALALPWPRDAWILANPPWVSFSGRHAARAGSAPEGPGGWPSLHAAFLVRIARHVGEGGTGAALLVPGSLLELAGYGPARAAAREHVALACAPLELDERAFPGVLEPAALLVLRPRRTHDPRGPAPWCAPRDAEASELLERLARFPPLPPRSFADAGVHTGNCARELVLPAGAPGRPGLRQGRDLAPFALGAPSAALCTTLERGGERRFQFKALAYYRAFPVLLRQTAARPVAALHESPTYFRNSLLACRALPGLDPAFVVAVLNGASAAAWHRLRFRDARQRAFPQVKIAHLASQPFPIRTRDEDPALHDALAAAARRADQGAIDELLLSAFALPGPLAARALAEARQR